MCFCDNGTPEPGISCGIADTNVVLCESRYAGYRKGRNEGPNYEYTGKLLVVIYLGGDIDIFNAFAVSFSSPPTLYPKSREVTPKT